MRISFRVLDDMGGRLNKTAVAVGSAGGRLRRSADLSIRLPLPQLPGTALAGGKISLAIDRNEPAHIKHGGSSEAPAHSRLCEHIHSVGRRTLLQYSAVVVKKSEAIVLSMRVSLDRLRL